MAKSGFPTKVLELPLLEEQSEYDSAYGADFYKVYKNEDYSIYERFMSGRKHKWAAFIPFGNDANSRLLGVKFNKHFPLLGHQGWFAPEDISQSYFRLKLNTYSIDSINLKIDFRGATEFTGIDPEPDAIGMSYISYCDQEKIKKIQNNGLLLHAQFKELANRQNVRIFFLTALLSVVITTLLVFLFFAFYKTLFRFIVNSSDKK